MVANDINQHLPCDKSGNINTPNDVAHGDYIYASIEVNGASAKKPSIVNLEI